MRSRRSLILRCLVLSVAVLAGLYGPFPARADAIKVNLATTSAVFVDGKPVIFQGTITNQTGFDLNASDFFFNFFAFDPTAVSPTQLLGLSDFVVPSDSTSLTTDLFSVSMVSHQLRMKQSFPLGFFVQDAFGDQSVNYSVSVSSLSPIPEPPTAVLFVLGLVSLTIAGLITRIRT